MYAVLRLQKVNEIKSSVEVDSGVRLSQGQTFSRCGRICDQQAYTGVTFERTNGAVSRLAIQFPVEDEKKNLSDEESANFRLWKTSNFERYREAVRKIIDFDLDLIENRVDYIVCFWSKQSAMGGGTPAELTAAYRKQIPVYIVTEMPYEDMSGWVLSCADSVFRDFDSLKSFLTSRNQATGGLEKATRSAHT